MACTPVNTFIAFPAPAIFYMYIHIVSELLLKNKDAEGQE